MFAVSEDGKLKIYDDPVKTWTMLTPKEILPTLEEIETWVDRGFTALGFLTYEASSGFDPSLKTQSPRGALGYWEVHENPTQTPIPPSPENLFLGPLIPTWTQEEYFQAFQQVKDYLLRGDTYQVNLTLPFRTRILGVPTREGLFDLWLKGWGNAPGSQGAFCEYPGGWILSFSPELFFETEKLPRGETTQGPRLWRLRSRPMKGTRPRGQTSQEDATLAQDLLNSPKDRAENLMITDMIRSDMGQIALPGSVQVPRLFDLETYPTVHQMVSEVQAQTQKNFPEIMKNLFPCGSITGAPKVRTMEIISQLENSPRGIYTGTMGQWTAQGARMNVAIRTLEVNPQGEGLYSAGGGVVWDSQKESEWNEIQVKTRVLDPLIFPADLVETLRWAPGEGFFLPELHQARLEASCAALGFPLPPNNLFRSWKPQILGNGEKDTLRIRLVWTKKGEAQWTQAPLVPLAEPLILALAPQSLHTGGPFFLHKTTARGVYEDQKLSRPGAQEVLLYNTQGMITEGTFTNLVYRWEGELWTPPLKDGLLPGTYRAHLLKSGKVQERSLALEELPQVEEFILVNSLRGEMRAVL